MAQLGRSDITTEMQSKLPTNNVKFITALLLREFEEIMNESFFNLIDDDLSNISLSTGENAETYVIKGGLTEYGTLPLFWVDVEISFSGELMFLNSFSSNNNTVNVTAVSSGSSELTVSYSEKYDTVNQIVRISNTTGGFYVRGTSPITIPASAISSSTTDGTYRLYFFSGDITYMADL